MSLTEELKKLVKGDVQADDATRQTYSHDTSLFEVVPEVVVFPRDREDVKNIVKYVAANKAAQPNLSITARSGGTDMSGGAINESIILVFERYFKGIGQIGHKAIRVEPGVYFRDFDKVTLSHNLFYPPYPASREIAALGGMVANNSGGEKSLAYGKTEDYVKSVKAVLADGNEYAFGPLNDTQLRAKLAQTDFEGQLYNKIFKIVDGQYDLIKKARPNVSKNSTGYIAWRVWDKDKKVFDMSKLFIGSQGTLGLVTEAELALADKKPFSGMLVGYVRQLDDLSQLITTVVKHRPTSFETFDDNTLIFALKFFIQFRKTLGWWGLVKLAIGFIPDAFILMRGIPKLIILAEYEGDTEEEVKRRVTELRHELEQQKFKITLENAETEGKSKRFWLMRRESFNLLRKNVRNKHTAPFIDDFVIPPAQIPDFLPKLQEIVERYQLLYTIAGHLGDGNFHIIPLMDLTDPNERAKIEPCLKEVTALVVAHGGSISGEHNDGLIRGPWLEQQYGAEMMKVFRDIKTAFDPQNIFNPHKKTDANWDYSFQHMRDHF